MRSIIMIMMASISAVAAADSDCEFGGVAYSGEVLVTSATFGTSTLVPGNFLFNCEDVTKVTFGDDLTSFDDNGGSMTLRNMPNLQEIVFGAGMTYTGFENSMYNSPSINRVVIRSAGVWLPRTEAMWHSTPAIICPNVLFICITDTCRDGSGASRGALGVDYRLKNPSATCDEMPSPPPASHDGAIIELTGHAPKIVFGTPDSPICELVLDRTSGSLKSSCDIDTLTSQTGRRLGDSPVRYDVLRKEIAALKAEVSALRDTVLSQQHPHSEK
jgi:hypothetical protein